MTARETAEILEEAVVLLEEVCREGDVDTEALPEEPAESADARILCDAGRSWARAFASLDSTLDDALIRSVFVAGKVARLALEQDIRDVDLWSYDMVPNLLVVERVLATSRSDVERHRASLSAAIFAEFDEADTRLRALLAPLFDAISESDRAAFAALIAAKRAPSPLATATRAGRMRFKL